MELPFVSRKKYDEVVYKLECLICHATGGRYSKAGYELLDMERMVSDYMEQCMEQCELDAIKEARATFDATGWCNVKDQLPEMPGYYLIYDKYDGHPRVVFFHQVPEHLTSGRYAGITQYFGNVSDYASGRITHWQPLPEPPKEEGENA